MRWIAWVGAPGVWLVSVAEQKAQTSIPQREGYPFGYAV